MAYLCGKYFAMRDVVLLILLFAGACKQPIYSDMPCQPVTEVMYDMVANQVIESFDTDMCHCLEDQSAANLFNKNNFRYVVKCVPY